MPRTSSPCRWKTSTKPPKWYGAAFGLVEVESRDDPVPTVILERDGVQIGFAVNGGDASQEGAAILVNDIHKARDEIEANGSRRENGAWMSVMARNTRFSS